MAAANRAKVAELYAQLTLETAQFKKALGEATSETQRFSKQMRAEMNEAKASIALVGEQIGVNLPRHLRGFVAQMPGVAKAMSAAFDAVAVIALIHIVVEAGEKVAEFIKKNEEAAAKSKEAWAKIHDSVHESNLELELSTIKIQNTLAKLEHKPENKLAEALKEAAIEAEHLDEKLHASIKSAADLMKEEAPGMLSQFLLGKAGTGYEQTMLDQHRIHLDESNTPEGKQSETNSYISSLKTRLGELKGWQDHPSATRISNNFQNEIDAVTHLLAQAQDEKTLISDTAEHDSAQRALDQKQQQEDADKAYLETLERGIERRKLFHDASVEEEYLYWEKYATAIKGEGKLATAIQKHYAEAREAAFKNLHGSGSISGDIKAQRKLDNSLPEFLRADPNIGNDQVNAALAKQREAASANSAALAEAREHIALASGMLSPHEAAMGAAVIHTRQASEELKALQDELDKLKTNDAWEAMFGVSNEKLAKETALGTQIDSIKTKMQIAALEDSQRVLSTTWTGMIDSVFDELVKKSQETTDQVKQVTTQFLDSMNAELAKGLTGNKMDFSRVFMGAAQGTAKSGLEHLEGGTLKFLRGAEGSHKTAEALNKIHDSLSGSVPALSSRSMSQMADYTGANDLTKMNLAGIFGVGGSSVSLAGAYADGGDALGGVPIMVGEKGPETLILPPSGGHVVPNGSQAGHSTVLNIDARGTDAAQVEARVHSAISSATMMAVSAATSAMEERMRRSAR